MKQFLKIIISNVLTWESKIVLKKYKPKIIAVTGSVGKTTTKDMIFTVVSSTFNARKSQKSFNSEIGVPLTVLGLENGWSNPFKWIANFIEGLMLIILPYKYPEILVLEIGADRPGDIEKISTWVKPDIAVLTRFGEVPSHVEFFPSVEDLVNEKGSLVRALKEGGTFVYNSDDKHIMNFAQNVSSSVKKISYGFKLPTDVHASHESITYGSYEHTDLQFPYGMKFNVTNNGAGVPITLTGSVGLQHIYPALAACAVTTVLAIDPLKASEAIKEHVPPKGRMRLLAGIKDTLLIDDSYNSSPVAAHAALATLEILDCAGRKIAVLGDMMELGNYSIEEHKKMGKLVAKVADMLVTVGVRTRITAESAQDNGMSEKDILQFDSAQEAGKFLESVIGTGDLILIKGSQAMRMEKAVEELMMHPEKVEELLVRQDRQWVKK